MNTITYKGYPSRVDFDEVDSVLVGKILGIQVLVSFHADNVADLRVAFHEEVDDYIHACAQVGKAPQKPASGKLILRMDSSIHSAALIAAQASGMSLNQWASSVLQQAARERLIIQRSDGHHLAHDACPTHLSDAFCAKPPPHWPR